MYGGYFETKEQAEEYKKKHELYVMIPFFSPVKKKWCMCNIRAIHPRI